MFGPLKKLQNIFSAPKNSQAMAGLKTCPLVENNDGRNGRQNYRRYNSFVDTGEETPKVSSKNNQTGSYTMMGGKCMTLIMECETLVDKLIIMYDKVKVHTIVK